MSAKNKSLTSNSKAEKKEVNGTPKSKSYVHELTEEEIQNEKCQIRCEQMMSKLNSLTSKSEKLPDELMVKNIQSSNGKKENKPTSTSSVTTKVIPKAANGNTESDSSDDDDDGPTRLVAPTELKEEVNLKLTSRFQLILFLNILHF